MKNELFSKLTGYSEIVLVSASVSASVLGSYLQATRRGKGKKGGKEREDKTRQDKTRGEAEKKEEEKQRREKKRKRRKGEEEMEEYFSKAMELGKEGVRAGSSFVDKTKDFNPSLSSSGARFFEEADERDHEIKKLLNSNSDRQKLEGLKKLIAVPFLSLLFLNYFLLLSLPLPPFFLFP